MDIIIRELAIFCCAGMGIKTIFSLYLDEDKPTKRYKYSIFGLSFLYLIFVLCAMVYAVINFS